MSGLTGRQQDAVDSRKPRICVSAGAGSGKTRILIRRMVHLLEDASLWPGQKPRLEQIVAITFMEKAAAEMKARLRLAFREQYERAIDRDTVNLWRKMERRVDTARISTIHAFCAGFLRRNALYIGMPPDWQVLGDADAELLAEQTITQTLQRLLEAGEESAERLCLRFQRNRLKDMLRSLLENRSVFRDLPPDWFSDPARLEKRWQEERPALHEALLESLQHAPEIGNYLETLSAMEGVCTEDQAVLERKRETLVAFLTDMTEGQRPFCAALERLDSTFPEGGRVKKHTEASRRLGEIVADAKKWLQAECSLPSVEELLQQDAAQAVCDLYSVGAETLRAYEQAKRALPALDYDDMIWETLRALRTHPDLRTHTARDIRFLLVDEFQDTDPGQMEIIHLLRAEKGGPHTFVVGDAKQSIYFFRGADVHLFQQEMGGANDLIQLQDNFRTASPLLCFVNDFFNKTNLLAAVGPYQSMMPKRDSDAAPCIELLVTPAKPDGKALPAAEQRRQEAAWIASRIRSFCGGDAPVRVQHPNTDIWRPAAYGDVALLFRRISYMHVYEQALRDAGIPYTRVSGAGFFECREVLDVAALLQWLADPWDEEAMLTVLRSPLVGLSDDSLVRMTREKSLGEAFFSDADGLTCGQDDVIAYARSLFDHLYQRRYWTPADLLRHILEYTRYEAVLLAGFLGVQKASNLRKLVSIAEKFGVTRPGTLAEFARHIQELRSREIREGEAPLLAEGGGAVLLLTIHKAKGLEFPVVFIPEMNASTQGGRTQEVWLHPEIGMALKAMDEWQEGKNTPEFWLAGKMRKAQERAEEWRTLYVAMTRARDRLILCGGEKAQRNSWFSVFYRQLELEDRPHDSVIEGKGWTAVLKCEVTEQVRDSRVSPQAAEYDCARIAAHIVPIPETQAGVTIISVSHLLDLLAGNKQEWDPAASPDLADPDAEHGESDRAFAMARGQLVHRLFELWDFNADTCPSFDDLLAEMRFGLQRRAFLKKHLQHIVRRFRASEYFPLFAGAKHLLREQPFLLDIGPAMVHGVIDALLDGEIVVDYKTGKPDPERERGYHMQIQLYAAAVRALTGKLPQEGLLWYADHGVMHPVPLDTASIETLLARARETLQDSNN